MMWKSGTGSSRTRPVVLHFHHPGTDVDARGYFYVEVRALGNELAKVRPECLLSWAKTLPASSWTTASALKQPTTRSTSLAFTASMKA
jgi:hypothetical protein